MRARGRDHSRFAYGRASLLALMFAIGAQAADVRPAQAQKDLPAAQATPGGARSAGVARTSFPVGFPGSPAVTTRALAAFRAGCPALIKRRADRSGLNVDWRGVCALAADWPDARAGDFFVENFEPVIVGDGQALVTGYYEPEIAGTRTPSPGYAVPIYGRPDDLLELDLGDYSDKLPARTIGVRLEGSQLRPYPDRAAIEDGALAGRNLEIAWAADPVEFFFLQIQGSGRLRLPDGGVMRIGFAGRNGRDYVGIGGLMRQRKLVGPGQTSMMSIMAWLRAHPVEGRALMRENRNYIFFREILGPGPLGSLGVPVTPRASLAADPLFTPLGAPVWLDLDRNEADGLWIAQDTGSAIKGANRFDSFWGAGAEARQTAGGLYARGRATLLLPRGTVKR